LLVVDFSPHDLVELKREHAHVHLGFADNQVQGWLKSAGPQIRWSPSTSPAAGS